MVALCICSCDIEVLTSKCPYYYRIARERLILEIHGFNNQILTSLVQL